MNKMIKRSHLQISVHFGGLAFFARPHGNVIDVDLHAHDNVVVIEHG